MRSLKENIGGMVDITIVIAVGIVFAALMVIAFIIWTLRDQLLPTAKGPTTTELYNKTYDSIGNITTGFDQAVALMLIAITVFILALAISALLMLRGR